MQCLSMAEVLNLECSLTLSPRDLKVSPMFEELQPSACHSSGIQHPSFDCWGPCLWDALGEI